MIRNERELNAVIQWLAYWKQNRSGEQSWIGNEQARQHVSTLRKQIDEYKRRTGVTIHIQASAAPQRQPEASTRTVNRVAMTEPDSQSG